jgi:hypothetical protein
MIEIFKAENPKVIPYVVNKFAEFENLDPRKATEHLLIKLAQDPEGTGIFVIFEDGDLKAFIFGWINEIDNIAWIQQAWADPSVEALYKNELFEKFADWGRSLGATHIQAQTQRMKLKAWKKLYGLTEHAVVLQKEL